MKILLFAIIGGILGYYAGAYASCEWLWPEMNLCGLTGVFITGPLGILIGSAIGWRQRRQNRRDGDQDADVNRNR